MTLCERRRLRADEVITKGTILLRRRMSAFGTLADVHADRYFGRYRGKNGHTASTREPTRLPIWEVAQPNFL